MSIFVGNIVAKMMRKFYLIIPIALLCTNLFSQEGLNSRDSLEFSIGTGALLSSEAFAPFYLVNNQFGEVDDQSPVFVKGALMYDRKFDDDFSLSSGFSFRNSRFSSYYLSANWKFLSVDFGAVKKTLGGISPGLSPGSLGVSQNARPIPQLSFAIKEYTPLPFADGYFKVKGSLSQGWFEKDRYISKALLHSKSFHFMLDLDREFGLQLSTGMIHFAQYGGIAPSGAALPSGFSDFLKIFLGKGIDNAEVGTAGEANALGNHLGMIEGQIKKRIGEHWLTWNYQNPFDDRGSASYLTFADFVMGIEWDLPDRSGWLEKLYVELLQTKKQSGPGIPDATATIQTIEENRGREFGERDDYYNNFLYQSGWTHHGMVVGNPLFLTHERSLKFLGSFPNYDAAIANNRIWALHIAFEGNMSKDIFYKFFLTYSRNFGTYAGLYGGRFEWQGIEVDPEFEYPFLPGKKQVYSMFELNYSKAFNSPFLDLKMRLAVDSGQLYNATGVEFSVLYRLSKH